jgi:ferric iron reductase protein FhuF
MKELELFQVQIREQAHGFMTLQQAVGIRYSELANEIKQQTEAPTEAVASSIFMRRFGFFITAQLYLLAHGEMWDGPFDAVHLVKTESGIAFEIDERFLRSRREGDLELVLKEYAFPVVEKIRKAGHVSKLILWENIWGYAIWMYGMLDSAQAARDVQALIDDAIWQPEMRKSFFRQFLDGRSFEEAKTDYKRVTCCLYKELPATGKCPYCPVKK